MHQHHRRALAIGSVAISVAGLSLAAAAPATATHHPRPSATVTTVISNLNAPRGIALDSRGGVYVAESGVAGTGAAGLTHTGRVSRYTLGSSTPTWSQSFESLFVTEDPSQPPDVLGPEGLSLLCNRHRYEHHNGHHGHGSCKLDMIMSESHDGVAAATKGAVQSTQLGHLFGLSPFSGRARDLADVGDQNYKWTGDHKALFPSDFPDSNPYGVLQTDTLGHGPDASANAGRHSRVRTFVADAGANTIDEVMRDGTVRVVAYIPNETGNAKRDATPTCIAQGPDGMLYVATLNLLSNLNFGPGKSNVWRVDPNANYPTPPTLWATGLTTATACTFDHEGNFWATEMFAPNGKRRAPGDIVRIPFDHPTHLTRFGGGRLPLPGGIAVAWDDSLYVTVNSAVSTPDPKTGLGLGKVVKVTLSHHHHH